ncbi:DUF4258 domain-containing protein [Sulfurimonas sp.]|uniref:DUF4258 domain-containing protein n=1 Tax=Sulfurimonas sp. TaxID=2022749 RepID=UPI0025DAE964|nr:DUF4258 domain-containing protein [Sulfurimonas sp.]MBT5934132.1 DUF4258 domain-containing protein [Sulfurimonas sp.]
MNKQINWNEEKNQLLQIQRGISFEMVLEKLLKGEIIGRKSHPNSNKYPNQKIFILELDDYICFVAFVENDTEIFLKTIIPSRKLNKEHKGDRHE